MIRYHNNKIIFFVYYDLNNKINWKIKKLYDYEI